MALVANLLGFHDVHGDSYDYCQKGFGAVRIIILDGQRNWGGPWVARVSMGRAYVVSESRVPGSCGRLPTIYSIYHPKETSAWCDESAYSHMRAVNYIVNLTS